jgi:hypothetical protein
VTRNSIRLKKCCTNVATTGDVGNRLTAGRKEGRKEGRALNFSIRENVKKEKWA